MLETQENSQTLVPEMSAVVRSKAEKVLIADDEPIIRDICRKSLVLKVIRGALPPTARSH
jgi:hypothetical protein